MPRYGFQGNQVWDFLEDFEKVWNFHADLEWKPRSLRSGKQKQVTSFWILKQIRKSMEINLRLKNY